MTAANFESRQLISLDLTGETMDAGLLVILLIPVGLLLLLPLLGRLWSAILSYVVFGLIFGFGLMGYFILSNNPGEVPCSLHSWIFGSRFLLSP